ncbi:hypothetical protein AB0F03_37375 [Streptomyces sp. NPDC028722]|uniref:hypothetical protein n=1 Tax=Streptomyces sp. NPDC028722 TaxID=3155016 RepID=UPI0033DD8080
MTQRVLRQAAALLRRRAAEAIASPKERWMVDQGEEGALVLAAFPSIWSYRPLEARWSRIVWSWGRPRMKEPG